MPGVCGAIPRQRHLLAMRHRPFRPDVDRGKSVGGTAAMPCGLGCGGPGRGTALGGGRKATPSAGLSRRNCSATVRPMTQATLEYWTDEQRHLSGKCGRNWEIEGEFRRGTRTRSRFKRLRFSRSPIWLRYAAPAIVVPRSNKRFGTVDAARRVFISALASAPAFLALGKWRPAGKRYGD
jgi:hypothetical protein